jgi:hypothetical protein
VLVPTNVTTGPIRVSTFNDILGEGAVLSDVLFYKRARAERRPLLR